MFFENLELRFPFFRREEEVLNFLTIKSTPRRSRGKYFMKKIVYFFVFFSLLNWGCKKEKYDRSEVRIEIVDQNCCGTCADGKFIKIQIENDKHSTSNVETVDITFRDCNGRTYWKHWDFANSNISPGIAPGKTFTSLCFRLAMEQGEFCRADCEVWIDDYYINVD